MFSGFRSVWMRFRSCRTAQELVYVRHDARLLETLTCYTSKELSRKTLNLAVGEWHEVVAFKEVEDTLSEQVGDDADMTSIIETVSEMNTPVSVIGVVCFEGR
jgi:hypothetical protein